MNDAKRVGPCRYVSSSAKPRMERPSVRFFRCTDCGTVLRGSFPAGVDCTVSCCGSLAQQLIPQEAESLPVGRQLSYDIVGGLNENCIRAFWQGTSPDWLYLETFTGGQHMLLKSKKRPPAVFALAGEDAYAYCDKDPCIKCSFRCKSGFVLYAYFADDGLYALPVNQIAATPGSSVSTTRTPQHNQ